MLFLETFAVGLALSADAFSVTLSNAAAYPGESRQRLMLMPILCGLFQGIMPVVGYLAGGVVEDLINSYAGIVVFVILAAIGVHMAYEGYEAISVPVEETSLDPKASTDPVRLSVGLMILQAVATAIDAFAVGVGLRAAGAQVIVSSICIGLTTFVCCMIALFIGVKAGRALGGKAEIAGGIILVLIGIRHLF